MRLREYDAPSRVAEGVSGVVVFDADLADARQRLYHTMSVALRQNLIEDTGTKIFS